MVDALVLRYLGAFGPASVADVQAWSGLTRLREVVERLPVAAVPPAGRARCCTSCGMRRGRPRTHLAPPRFLTEYDNLLLSHDDRMSDTPVNLSQVLAAFSDIYSPRIVGRVNDYDIRVAHARGEHVWHVHDHTDEFFLVIDGQFDIALREGDGERTVSLRSGDIFVVPQGVEHKPSSPGGSILMFEPTGTLTTGDRHDGEIPGHVDSTVGREISG